MALLLPVHRTKKDGTPVIGWWTVSKSKAGEILMREAQAPAQYRQAAARIILKLAAREKLERDEVAALRLLHGFALLGSQKVQYQAIGHKILTKALDELLEQYPDDIEEGLAQKALAKLGLA